MRFMHRSGVWVLAIGAGLTALQLEPTVLRDLVVESGSQRIAVGAVKVPLWSAAWAQSPDTFSLENVTFTFGSATYEAKRVEFAGVTSSRADIEALFSSTTSEPFANRLARVSAKRIAIPDLKVKQKVGPETQTSLYKNIVLNDVAQGRIGLTAVEATALEISEGKTRTNLTYGRISLSDLDMPSFAKLYETKSETASEPLNRIHGAFSIDNIGIVDSQGVSLKVARISGRDFMARPTRDSWTGSGAFFAEMAEKDEPTAEEQARMIMVAADVLSAFDISFAEATGIEMKIAPKAMKQKKGHVSELTAKIGRMAYTSGTASQPADIRLEGFEAFDQEARMAVATMSLTGFSFKPTLDAMKATKGKELEELDPAVLRAFVPTLGTLQLAGVDLDVSQDKEKGKKPERIKVRFDNFEFTADKPLNGTPTNIKIGLQGLSIPLPANSKDDGIKDLLALGYKTFNWSTSLAASWNEATNEIAISHVSDSQNMARISVAALLGNVTKDVFSPDTDAATVAAVDARAKSLDIVIESHGLLDLYIARAAKEEKTTPEALRKSYSVMAVAVIPTMLGESEQAKAIGQAIARFIEKPGRLVINAKAKDPTGLSMLQIMALANSNSALDKLNIVAKAE